MPCPRLPAARAALAALSLVALGACGSADAPAVAAPAAGLADGLPAACNPLRSAGACLFPFPSAVYLDDDPSSATKLRVHLSLDAMPRNAEGKGYDPSRLNGADGFSPSAELLAYFPERLDPTSLPSIRDPGQSLAPTSATVIVDMETGALVPHWSEVDAQVTRDSDRQALILRPITRLTSARRYAVAVTSATRTLAGGPPVSPPGWAAIAEGSAKDGLAGRQAQRMPAIFAALAKAGVARERVLLAWDLVTASDENLTRTMRSMRTQTLSELGATGLGYTITSVEEEFSAHALRRVRGTFTVPKFLSQTDKAVAAAAFTFDASGAPKQGGTYEAPFTLILPRSVSKGKVGLLIFGHGFLGTGEGELGDASGSYLQDFADAQGFAIVATDWIGLSRYEGIDATGSGAAAAAMRDLNGLPWITDRLEQAVVNVITLARTAKGAIAKDPNLSVAGATVVDDSRIDYFGISLGGVMGSAVMGFSPDLERGALNVGAAGWSTLLQRSQDWALFKLILDGSYRDKLDQQLVIELLQAHLDEVDGMSIAPHVLADPLTGNAPKHVLLQMGVNDPAVPNPATEGLARALPLPLLSDTPLPIYGLTTKPGPLPSALTVWDLKEEAPPETNLPLSVASPNKVHDEVRKLPAVEAQLGTFLKTGDVKSFCTGICDPE